MTACPLQEYFMAHVLHAQWAQFLSKLQDAQNLLQLQGLHNEYLEQLFSSCLLGPSSKGPRQVITSMVALVLTFVGQIKEYEYGTREGTVHALSPANRQDLEVAMLRTGSLFKASCSFLRRLLDKHNILNFVL